MDELTFRLNRIQLGLMIFWLALVLLQLNTIWHASATLPATVPSHFNAAGYPDNYATRGSFVHQWLFLTLGMNALFFVLYLLIPRFPASMVNVPYKRFFTATPERWAVAVIYVKALMALCGVYLGILLRLVWRQLALWSSTSPGADQTLLFTVLAISTVALVGFIYLAAAWVKRQIELVETGRTV